MSLSGTALLYEHSEPGAARWTLTGLQAANQIAWQGASLDELSAGWSDLSRSHSGPWRQSVVAAATSSFLFATFPRAEVAGATRATTLRYRLEAELPHAAEDLACDFQFGAGPAALVAAVAVERVRWLACVQQLQLSDCPLQLFAPKSLLLIQALTEQKSGIDRTSLVLLHLDGIFEIVAVRSGQLVHWRLCGEADTARIDWHMLCESFTQDQWAVVDVSAQPLSSAALAAIVGIELLPIHLTDERKMVEQQITSCLEGRSEAWFDLSRDDRWQESSARGWRATSQLASPRFQLGMLSLSVWLLCLAAACWWRADRLTRAADELQRQQRTLAQSAVPDQQLPSAVLARLKSEHAKLTGSRTTNRQLEPSRSMLPTLRQLIENLPEQLTVSVIELRIDGNTLFLDVELSTIQDAGLLTQVLQSSGLQMTPPSTTAAADGKVRAQLRGVRGDVRLPTAGGPA